MLNGYKNKLYPLLEDLVQEYGKTIFDRIGSEQPSTFNKHFWTGRLMAWSIKHPVHKYELFRLVDVLPSLNSNEAVLNHLHEYLSKGADHLPAIFQLVRFIPPKSWLAVPCASVVRKSVGQMAAQFIAGSSPDKALSALKKVRKKGIAFTVDLLGEFCLSEREALDYLERYLEALEVFSDAVPNWNESYPLYCDHPGESTPVNVSVKLTALYSQCNLLNFERSVNILSERLSEIAQKAKEVNAALYVDAEDCANNPIIYETYKRIFGSGPLKDFPYPGIVVQAYAKNAGKVINDLLDFAKKRGTPISVRLVKGAYWDYETILSRQKNKSSPLFSYKESSDANYEALSRILLDNHELCLPAFGSHNVRSLCYACCYAKELGLTEKDFELQMLYGMADPIAQAFAKEGYLVRLYVPVGEMLPGMGYLVRRLLENTSNESFLKHTFFDSDKISELLKEPRMHIEDAQAVI